MKKSLLIALVVVLIALLSLPCVSAVKVGSTVHNPEWQRITVANPGGIDNAHKVTFAFGEEVAIGKSDDDHDFIVPIFDRNSSADKEATCDITVIKLDGNRVLCEYKTSEMAYGSMCPTGTIFFLTKAEFTRQLTNYERKVREERKIAREEKTRQDKEKILNIKEEEHVKLLLAK